MVTRHGEGGHQVDRAFVTVQRHAGLPGARGQAGNRGSCGPRRLLQHVCAQRVDRIQRKLGHHVEQPAHPNLVATHQGQDVATGLDRVAGVGLDDGQHILVQHPALGQPQVWNTGALFKHRAGIGRETEAAHVNGVAG